MIATHHSEFTVKTKGKSTQEITDKIQEIVEKSKIQTGVVTVFIKHTSASLIIFENADPSARTDLESFLERLIPANAPYFSHTFEGSDDMPSHIRMVLTRTSESIPIQDGRLCTGTWQGLFVYEHRQASHQRTIVVSVIGETE